MEFSVFFFFFQAEDGIRDYKVTGVQTCALPISPEPDPPRRPALQYLRFAQRRVRDRDGRADDEGGALRQPPALARARLHPPRAESGTGARRAAHARERAVPRRSGAVRLRPHAARLATARRPDGVARAASLSAAAGVWDQLRARKAGDRRAALGAGAAAGKRVHPAPGHRRDRRVGADPRFAGAGGAHWREGPCPGGWSAGDTAAKVNASTGDRA